MFTAATMARSATFVVVAVLAALPLVAVARWSLMFDDAEPKDLPSFVEEGVSSLVVPANHLDPSEGDDQWANHLGPNEEDDQWANSLGPGEEDDQWANHLGPGEEDDQPANRLGPSEEDDQPANTLDPGLAVGDGVQAIV